MYTEKKTALYASLTAMTFYIAISPYGNGFAEEITPFRLTDINGFFGIRYRHDTEVTQQITSPESEDMRTYLEEEFNIQTQGYVYHPNFLKINLGGGIVFNQEDLETATGDAEYDDTLTNLNARLSFLENKPYPLTLYYDKSHPAAALSVTDVFIQENEKYGMHFSLKQPLSPVMINVETYQQSNTGDSFTQVTDEMNTYQSINAHTGFANGGFLEISHTRNQLESRTGSKSMPIIPFDVDSESTDLHSRLLFGEKNNIRLDLISTYTTLEKDRDLDELRFAPYLNWEHNKQISSYYQYRLLDREQLGILTKNTSAAAGGR